MAEPIIVQGKDGQEFEFPEGTSDDVMKQALRKHYGQPAQAQPNEVRQPTGSPLFNAVQSAAPSPEETARLQSEAKANEYADMFSMPPMAERVGALGAASVNAMTIGNLDNINAKVDQGLNLASRAMGGERDGYYSGTFDDRKRVAQGQRQQLRDDYPVSSTAGAIHGFLAPGGLVAGAGKQVAARVPQASGQGLAYGQRLAGLSLLGGAENALYEGTVGASNRGAEQGRDVGASEALEMAKDGGTDPIALAAGPLMSGLYRAGRGVFSGSTTPAGVAPATPSVDELEEAKRLAYKEADQAGVQYSEDGYMNLVSAIEQKMKSMNFDPMTHPKAARMLDRLVERVGESPTLSMLDNWRKTVSRDIPASAEPAEKMFASIMRDEIDGFVSKGSDVVSGSGREGAEKIAKARELNTTFRKSELIEDAVKEAELRAASTGSGGNFENALRQNFRKILSDPKKSGSFTPDELKLLEQAVRGTSMQNMARLVGKLSPEGNGLMAMMGVGGTVSNPFFAAVPAVGFAAKRFAQSGAQRNANALSEAVRGNPAVMQQLLAAGKAPAQSGGNALAQAGDAGMAGMPPLLNALYNALESNENEPS